MVVPGLSRLMQGPINRFKQDFIVAGFLEKVHSASLHGPDARGDGRVCRKENDRHIALCGH
jgi:hypothetical protein